MKNANRKLINQKWTKLFQGMKKQKTNTRLKVVKK